MQNHRSTAWERGVTGLPRSGAFDAMLVRLLLKGFSGVPLGFALWDGTRLPSETARPVVWIHVHDRRSLLRLALNPDLQFGELYSAGRLDVEGSLVEAERQRGAAVASEHPPSLRHR